jgi:hypothetical protein
MKMSFCDILRYLGFYVDEDLISAQSYGGICTKFKNLPSDISGQFGFESVLNDLKPKADFSMRIKPYDLFSLTDTEDRRFALLKNVLPDNFSGSIWLEFDSVPGNASPGLFFEFDKNDSSGNIIPILIKYGADEFIIRNIGDFISKSGNITIRYFGFFPERTGECFRLSLVLPDKKSLFDRMSSLFDRQLNEIVNIDLFFNMADYFILNVDVGKYLSSSFSVEFRLDDIAPENQKRWNEFLRLLYNDEFCIYRKYHALKNWPGEGHEIFNTHLSKYRTFRLINHFKISFYPDKKNVFKAYYGFINKEIKFQKNKAE